MFIARPQRDRQGGRRGRNETWLSTQLAFSCRPHWNLQSEDVDNGGRGICVCPRVAPMLAASSSRRARTPGPEPRRSAASRTSANVRSTSRSSPWTSTAMRSRPTRRPFPLETALGTPERPILGTASSPSSREARRRYGEACRLATPLACSWSSRRADSLEDQESIWFGRVGRIHANPVPVGVVGV